MGKFAIVQAGGGASGVFSYGAELAIKDILQGTKSDINIGASIGSLISTYTASGQIFNEDFFEVLTKMFKTKDLIKFRTGFFTGKIIDIRFVKDFLKKEYPVDEESINSELYVVATNSKNAKLSFLPYNKTNNIYDLIEVSQAMAGLYKHNTLINNEHYVDTYLSSRSINSQIKKAVELGADKIIAINPNVRKLNFLSNVWLNCFNNKEFKESYKKENNLDTNYKIPENVKVAYLYPENGPGVKVLTTNIKKLEEARDFGKTLTYKNSKKIEDLFK